MSSIFIGPNKRTRETTEGALGQRGRPVTFHRYESQPPGSRETPENKTFAMRAQGAFVVALYSVSPFGWTAADTTRASPANPMPRECHVILGRGQAIPGLSGGSHVLVGPVTLDQSYVVHASNHTTRRELGRVTKGRWNGEHVVCS